MRTWLAAGALLAAGAAIWLLAFRDGGPESSPAQSESTGGAEVSAPASAPSRYARRVIPPADLRTYREIGQELGLDWAVLAAVDRLERHPPGLPARDRILGVGYGVRGHGGAADSQIALEQYGGSRAYARRALALADRFRAVTALPKPTRGPLQLPVDGSVLAAYGQQYGLLHDGIDVAAATGDEVWAAADGITLSTGFSSIYGEYTCVLHRFRPPLDGEEEFTTCYGNQSEYETAPGDRVRAGETIGRVGCSGPCLRPHLHFQVRLGRSAAAPTADPERFLAPGTEVEAGRPLEAG